MHRANHPTTHHYIEDVFSVDPVAACAGRPVGLAWFSPDCKHHSKAKGGRPRDANIRGLATVAVDWAKAVRPRVIALENVEEFRDWGPLDDEGNPIKERKGETFREFVADLEALGYNVEHRLLRASDYGTPTYRRRLILLATLAKPAWPKPTHGPGLLPFRTAGECMDWTIPIPSIFGRPRELADKTHARIAHGLRKFVIECRAPYVVPMHGGLAVPYLIHRSNGERVGQAPRTYDINRPLGTIVAQGQKHALVVAWLAKHYGNRPTGGWPGGSSLHDPIGTVTARDHHSLVAAYLVRYNGQSGPQPLDVPIGTLDTRDRYGLVSITIDGQSYSVSDIGMRGLVSRELFRCNGFPEDYEIAPIGPNGKPLSATAQKRMCGNAVCPPLASAVVRAQFEVA